GISGDAWNFVQRILNHGLDLCLILNSSVNSYRRLDPHYEAPNQIKASAIDRGSMVRIPIGNAKSARIEVRSIAPDANPYMTIYSLFKIGTDSGLSTENRVLPNAVLPDNIYDAIDHFCGSEVIRSVLGNTVTEKYGALKQASAERCPRLLGSKIKPSEIQFHHEVTNQFLWNQF